MPQVPSPPLNPRLRLPLPLQLLLPLPLPLPLQLVPLLLPGLCAGCCHLVVVSKHKHWDAKHKGQQVLDDHQLEQGNILFGQCIEKVSANKVEPHAAAEHHAYTPARVVRLLVSGGVHA